MERRIKANDKDKYTLLCLVVFALIPRVIYLLYKIRTNGEMPVAYDTKVYLEQAYAFINNGIIDKDFNGVFYVGYYGVLGLLLKIFGRTEVIVYIQIFVNALTVILVYRLGMEILNRKAAAIISCIIYSFLFPLIHWSILITTDSFFITLLLFQAYLAVLCVKYGQRSNWIKLSIVSVYMVFYRPTGIVTLVFTALYLLLNADIKGFIKRHKKVSMIFLSLFVVLFTVTLKKLIDSPLRGSLERNLYWLLTEIYSNGQIYDIKTPYDLKFSVKMPPGEDLFFAATYFKYNFFNIMLLYLKRVVSFTGVWIWKLDNMSSLKVIGYILFYGSAYAFLIIGIVDMCRKKLIKKGSIIFFMILSILLFTTVFFMDSAYRYRVPALVFAMFPIGQGVAFTWDCIIMSRILKKIY